MFKKIKKYRSLLLVAAFFLVLSVTINMFISLEDVNTFSQTVQEWRNDMPILVILGFVMTYILIAALSIPVAALITLAAGAIFGTALGSTLVVIGATTGSIVPFLVVRYKFKEAIQEKYPVASKKIIDGLEHSGALYLLSARFAPIFPFYVTNAVSGLSKLKVREYAFITALGIIPGTVAYVFAGSQLEQAIETGSLVGPEIILGLGALSLVSLASAIVQRKVTKKHAAEASHEAA